MTFVYAGPMILSMDFFNGQRQYLPPFPPPIKLVDSDPIAIVEATHFGSGVIYCLGQNPMLVYLVGSFMEVNRTCFQANLFI